MMRDVIEIQGTRYSQTAQFPYTSTRRAQNKRRSKQGYDMPAAPQFKPDREQGSDWMKVELII